VIVRRSPAKFKVEIDDSYLFCYVRGPEGIIVALAEELA